MNTGWQVGIALASLAAVGLAAWAIYRAYQEAYGWPKTRWIDNDADQVAWYRDQLSAPERAAHRLRMAVQAAGASLAALLVAVGLLWFAPAAEPVVPLVHLTERGGTVLCGNVLTSAIDRSSGYASPQAAWSWSCRSPGSRRLAAPRSAEAHHGWRGNSSTPPGWAER